MGVRAGPGTIKTEGFPSFPRKKGTTTTTTRRTHKEQQRCIMHAREASFSFFFLSSLGGHHTQILEAGNCSTTTSPCSPPSPPHLCRVMSMCARTRSRNKGLAPLCVWSSFSSFWIHFHQRRTKSHPISCSVLESPAQHHRDRSFACTVALSELTVQTPTALS